MDRFYWFVVAPVALAVVTPLQVLVLDRYFTGFGGNVLEILISIPIWIAIWALLSLARRRVNARKAAQG